MTLPTPPSSSQRPKENVPPPTDPDTQQPTTTLPASGSGPRVEFAPSALYHPATMPPSASISSTALSRPLKSILKPARPPAPLAAPDEPPTPPPEPSAPIDDPVYLEGPLRVLARSLEAPPSPNAILGLLLAQPDALHDLTEAYTLLLARLKHTRLLLPSALAPLTEHRAALLSALERDVGRAIKPSAYVPSSSSSDRSSSPPPMSSPTPGPTRSVAGRAREQSGKKKTGVSAEEIRHVRDAVSLSHAALKVCAVLLLQPALHGVFSEKDQSALLALPLSIPLHPSLPTPNPRRTYHFALWALSNTRIPLASLHPQRDRLSRALTRALSGQLSSSSSSSSSETIKSESLNLLAALLTHYPSLLPTLTPLLPYALNSVLTGGKMKASLALGAFCIALKRTSEGDKENGKGGKVGKEREATERLTLQWLRAKRTVPGGASEERNADALDRTLRAALPSPTDQPAVLPTLAALLYLAGPGLLHAPPLKPLMLTLQATLKMRGLLGAFRAAWGVLVWSVGEAVERGVYVGGEKATERVAAELALKREKAERMVRQGVGALLRAGDPRGAAGVWADLARAGVRREWADAEPLVKAAGVGFLLPPSKGEAYEGRDALLCEAMWAGRDKFALPAVEAPPEEMGEMWDVLAGLWFVGLKADREDGELERLMGCLLDVRPEGEKVAGVVVRLLASGPADFTAAGEGEEMSKEAWVELVQGVLEKMGEKGAPMADVAQRVAERVFAHELEEWKSPTAWFVFQAARPSTLEALTRWVLREGTAEDEWTRAVWRVVLPQAGDEDLASVLALPGVRGWAMTESENALWEGVVWGVAGRRGDAAVEVVLGNGKTDELTLRALAVLVDGLRPPPSALLDRLGQAMRAAYGEPALLAPSLQVLRSLKDALARVEEVEGAVELASEIERGVGLWIRDEWEVMSEEEYNAVPVALYVALLTYLRPALQPPTPPQPALTALAPLLASAFYRMPDPGTGPRAFRDFWVLTFHRARDLSAVVYPDELKPALRYFMKGDVTFAPGLHQAQTPTDSAGMSQVIADSEPERLRRRAMMGRSWEEVMEGVEEGGEGDELVASGEGAVQESSAVQVGGQEEVQEQEPVEREDGDAGMHLEDSVLQEEPESEADNAPDTAIIDIDVASLEIIINKPASGESAYDGDISEPNASTTVVLNNTTIQASAVLDGLPPSTCAPQASAESDAIESFTRSRLVAPQPTLAVSEIESFTHSKIGLGIDYTSSTQEEVSAVAHETQETTTTTDSLEIVVTASAVVLDSQVIPETPQEAYREEEREDTTEIPSFAFSSAAAPEVVPETPLSKVGRQQEVEPAKEQEEHIEVVPDSQAGQGDVIPATPSPDLGLPSPLLVVESAEGGALDEDEEDAASIEASLSQVTPETRVEVPEVPTTSSSSLGKRKRVRSGGPPRKKRRVTRVESLSDDDMDDSEIKDCVVAVTPLRRSAAEPSKSDVQPEGEVSLQEVEDTFMRSDEMMLPSSQPVRPLSRVAFETPSLSQPIGHGAISRAFLQSPSLSQFSSSGSSAKRPRQFLDSVELPLPKRKKSVSPEDVSVPPSQPEPRLEAQKQRRTRSSARLGGGAAEASRASIVASPIPDSQLKTNVVDTGLVGTRHLRAQGKQGGASGTPSIKGGSTRGERLRQPLASKRTTTMPPTAGSSIRSDGFEREYETTELVPSSSPAQGPSSSMAASSSAAEPRRRVAPPPFDPASLPKGRVQALKALLKDIREDMKAADLSEVKEVQLALSDTLRLTSKIILDEDRAKK